MTAQAIPVKRGALLELSLLFQLDDGTPIDLSTATIATQVRDALGALQTTPAISLAAATGAAIFRVAGTATAALPLGALFGDVQLTLQNGDFFSETFTLIVSPAITHAGA